MIKLSYWRNPELVFIAATPSTGFTDTVIGGDGTQSQNEGCNWEVLWKSVWTLFSCFYLSSVGRVHCWRRSFRQIKYTIKLQTKTNDSKRNIKVEVRETSAIRVLAQVQNLQSKPWGPYVLLFISFWDYNIITYAPQTYYIFLLVLIQLHNLFFINCC